MTILVNIFVKTIKAKSNISFAIANIQRKVKQHKRKQENTLNGVRVKNELWRKNRHTRSGLFTIITRQSYRNRLS